MHFLLLNQFYPPDPAPTGWYLHGLARTLVQRGHSIKVLCSRRSYDGRETFPRKDVLDEVEVHRLPAMGFGRKGLFGKLADYTSFYGSLLLALMLNRRRPGMVLSLTTPPYIGVLGKLASWKHRCAHAHWIMDLYPDVLFAHGMARSGGFLCRTLKALTRFQLRGSHAVVALGPVMAEKVAEYVGDGKKAESRKPKAEMGLDGTEGRRQRREDRERRTDHGQGTTDHGPRTSDLRSPISDLRSPTSDLRSPTSVTCLPLWSDPTLSPWDQGEPNPLREQRGWNGDLVLLYSGNMGLGHRLNEFLHAARQLGPAGPRWVFSGGGKRRREIEGFAAANPQARIELLDYVPESSLRAHLCSADVHLASLDTAWQGLMVPSKLQASFAVGKPVIFVGDSRNETARWIEEAGAGWVVAENDHAGLLQAIEQARDAGERRKRGGNALQFAQTHFQMTDTCNRLAALLESAAGSFPVH